MTVTLNATQLVAGVVTATSFLIGIGYLVNKAKKAGRVLHAMSKVVERELNPNGGKSMKDDTVGLSVAVGFLGRGFDDLTARFEEHLEQHHREEIAP